MLFISFFPAPLLPPMAVRVTLIEDDTALVSWREPEQPNLTVTHYTVHYVSQSARLAAAWKVLQREGVPVNILFCYQVVFGGCTGLSACSRCMWQDYVIKQKIYPQVTSAKFYQFKLFFYWFSTGTHAITSLIIVLLSCIENTDIYFLYITGSNTMALLEKLESGNTYLVKVSASNQAGDGPFSSIVELSVPRHKINPGKNPRHTFSQTQTIGTNRCLSFLF